MSPPLWTRLYIRCNLCYISFFNDTNMSMVVRKKDFMGEIHLLIKKNCSQTQTSWVIFRLKKSRERDNLSHLFFFSIYKSYSFSQRLSPCSFFCKWAELCAHSWLPTTHIVYPWGRCWFIKYFKSSIFHIHVHQSSLSLTFLAKLLHFFAADQWNNMKLLTAMYSHEPVLHSTVYRPLMLGDEAWLGGGWDSDLGSVWN